METFAQIIAVSVSAVFSNWDFFLSQAGTQTFEKGGANFRYFTRE